MTAATAVRAFKARGTATEGRSEDELRDLVRHAGAELELAPAEDIIEWAVATFGAALLHHLVDGRRRPGPPRLHRRARHRRGLPRHRLPLRRDHRHPRRRRPRRCRVNLLIDHARSRPWPSRTRSTARTSSPATPTCAARCARSQPLAGVARPATTPGPPACVAPRPSNRVIAPGHRLGRQEGQGQGLPAGALGRRAGRGRTSPRTACWSTRCSTTATPRSAAGPAPAGWPPARTRAPAAGPAPARPSAASTSDPLAPRQRRRTRTPQPNTRSTRPTPGTRSDRRLRS